MARRYQYDSRELLKDRDDRSIGVLVSAPFHHHGLKATYVDVSRETVTVSSATYGNCYPSKDVRDQACSATEQTIADLDAVIAELAGHRDRLRAELSAIVERTWADSLVTPEERGELIVQLPLMEATDA